VLLWSAILFGHGPALRPLPAKEPPAPPITALAIAPHGTSVVVGSNAGVQVLAWPELESVGNLPSHTPHVHHVEFSPHGTRLAIAGGMPAQQGMLELFSWPARECLARLVCHDDVLYAVAWHPSLDQLAIAGATGRLAVLDVTSGAVVRECQGHVRDVLAACWLPDGSLVSASADASVRVWKEAKEASAISLTNHTAAAVGLARPSDGQQERGRLEVVSIGRDRTVRLWQPLRRRLVRFVRLPVEPLAVCWTHVPTVVAVACVDGHVRLIDTQLARVVADLPAIEGWAYCVAQHQDRSLVAAGEGGQVVRLEWPGSRP